MATARLSTMAVSLLLAWGLCLLSVTSFAASGDALLEQRVSAFLEMQASEFGRVDDITLHTGSARLPACDNPEPFLTNPEQRLYGRVAVGIRCGEQGSQVRYLQADVSVLVEHVVAARDIEAGTMLGPGDLERVEARLERLPRHALLDSGEAVGLVAARTLRAGTTLQAHHLRQEMLVKRGARVTVIARGAGFSVRREAQALDNGALGEKVRLRTESREQLEARVIGHGQLEIVF